MSDRYRDDRVSRAAPIFDHGFDGDGSRRRAALAHYAEASEVVQKPHTPEDVASVLGLPVAHLTAPVVAAVSRILSELERLRWRDGQSQRREAVLTNQADRHSLVPCLNRRAFLRELDLFLGGGEASGALLLLHITGVEALRTIHGLVAGDGAVRHACGHIIGALRRSDMVGLLSGSDFAVLLPASTLDDAREKADEIRQRLTDQPFTWLGQAVPLDSWAGIHPLRPGEGGEQAVAAADRTRRGMPE